MGARPVLLVAVEVLDTEFICEGEGRMTTRGAREDESTVNRLEEISMPNPKVNRGSFHVTPLAAATL